MRIKLYEYDQLHDGLVFWGAALGFVLGAAVMLLNLPQGLVDSRRKLIRTRVRMPAVRLARQDLVERSIEEGKEAARRHREQTRQPRFN